MTKFVSALAPLIEKFIKFRIASERWNVSYEADISVFDKFCSRKFPKSQTLTQEMIDIWCAKRDTESVWSRRQRCYAIKNFVNYLRDRGLTDVTAPILPSHGYSEYIPHAFTHDELTRFFEACDSIEGVKTQEQRMRRITVPVFFRLLYSSGMRTKEARFLRVEDVHLDTGLIDIKVSKGDDQHFVVLHDSMLQLMIKYDAAISKMMPNRIYFFPSRKNGAHTEFWIYKNFRSIWDSVNSSYAKAYELRHNYATVNINRWINCGMEISQKMVYLSKSMGHRNFSSTEGYYHLVPTLSNQVHQMSNASFEDLIPDLPYENQETE